MLASLIAGRAARALCPGPGRTRSSPSAEFALVGEVPPRVRRPEGPFGDHYGYYSLRHDYPVFQVDAALRTGATRSIPATVVGKPRQEDFFIGDLLQELLVAALPAGDARRSCDLWSYGETGYHSLAAAVVKERYTREAMASRVPHPRRGPAVADQVPARHRPARRPARLPRDARARARAHAPRDRSLRLLEPLDGHARLHRARR